MIELRGVGAGEGESAMPVPFTIDPKSAASLDTMEWSGWTSGSSKTASYIQLPSTPDSMPMIEGDVKPSVMPKLRGAKAAMSATRTATVSLPAACLAESMVESSKLASMTSRESWAITGVGSPPP